MNFTSKNLILSMFILFLAFQACKKDETTNPTPNPPSTAANKIMPLGASRVAGATPEYESYRYELWKLMIDGGHEFDFVGTEKDPGSYPAYNSLDFDNDHEGRGGITSGGILEEINLWLNDLGTSPDIVLFSSPGGNDGIENYEQTKLNINAIIDALQANNPNVTILLELPAPPLTNEQTPEFTAYYNQALQDIAAFAEQQSDATSQVITIDMKTGFEDIHLADDVHYSVAGAKFIADKYYEALVNVLE